MTGAALVRRTAAAICTLLGATVWVAVAACSDRSTPTADQPSGSPADATIRVDTARRYQVIDGFGAAATGIWHPQVREAFEDPEMVRLVIDDLGATIIRVGLPTDLRQTDGPAPEALPDDLAVPSESIQPSRFLMAVGQRRRDGADVRFIGTFWTPAPWMKTNNSPKDGGKLRPDRVRHFALLCASVCRGFERTVGWPLEAISIQNEPAFVEPYESCVYTPAEYAATVQAVGTALSKWHVGVPLFGPEDVGADPARFGRYVKAATEKPLPGSLSILALHGYAGDGLTARGSPEAWEKMHAAMALLDRPLWMTETSGHEPTWLGGTTRDSEQRPRPGALDMAVAIHDALVHGGVRAWLYWQITADRSLADQSLMIRMEPTPKFYAAKQYFRYIRRGAVRVECSSLGRDVLASAFVHDTESTLTIVLINRTEQTREVRVAIAAGAPTEKFEVIRSSANENAAALGGLNTKDALLVLTLPARSVTTLRGGLRGN